MNEFVKSPFNYTGGKFKLLPQIIPLFPEKIDTFIDLFGGGGNVGINVECNKNIYNELVSPIVDFFSKLYKTDIDYMLIEIDNILAKFNNIETKEDYLNLRDSYNKSKNWIELFILSGYAFNYVLRFNQKNEFNTPSGVGKSHLSKQIMDRLIAFEEEFKSKDFVFCSKDFNEFDISLLSSSDFVYCDPPYYLTMAQYNSYWNLDKEKELLAFLDNLDKNNIKFALSNVIFHKNKEHLLLKEWAKKYNTHILNMSYNNSWSCTKKKENQNLKTIEVLITNY